MMLAKKLRDKNKPFFAKLLLSLTVVAQSLKTSACILLILRIHVFCMINIKASFFPRYCINHRTSWNEMLLQYFLLFLLLLLFLSKRKGKIPSFKFSLILFSHLVERITRHDLFPKN